MRLGEAYKPTEEFIESIRLAEIEFMTNSEDTSITNVMKHYTQDSEVCMFANCMTDQDEIKAMWTQFHGSLQEYKLHFRNIVIEDGFFSREWVAYIRNGHCDAWVSGYSLFLINDEGLVSRQMEWTADKTNGWETVYDPQCFETDTKAEL